MSRQLLTLAAAGSTAMCLAAGPAVASSPPARTAHVVVRKAVASRRETVKIAIHDPAASDRVKIWIAGHRLRKPVIVRDHRADVRRAVDTRRSVVVRAVGRHARPTLKVTVYRHKSTTATPTTSGTGSTTTGTGTTTTGTGTHKSGTPASPTKTTAAPTSTSTTGAAPTPAPTPAPTNPGGYPDPSGEPMPTGNIPGWNQVFADDFTGSSDSCWGAYQGTPPSSPTGLWEPSHVGVSGGMAQLASYRDPAYGDEWVNGGMSSAPCLHQEYGKYEVRFKMNKADGIKYAILLWPTSGNWPCDGEIDFGEDGGGNRSSTTLTDIYCGAGGSEQQLPQDSISADFSQWQTLGVEWTPQTLTETLNGQDVATISSADVPADPMDMDIQAESNTNCSISYYSCVDSTTPATTDLDVDWVVAYSRA